MRVLRIFFLLSIVTLGVTIASLRITPAQVKVIPE